MIQNSAPYARAASYASSLYSRSIRRSAVRTLVSYSNHKDQGGESAMEGHRAIVWFRNDLRLHDNEVIHKAVELATKGQVNDVVPVFCFDPRWFTETSFKHGCVKTGPFRAQYLVESVHALKHNLKGIGSDLVVMMGSPEEEILKLVPQGWRTTVFAQSEVTSEETDAEDAVRDALESRPGSTLDLVWGSTLYHLDDLPFDVGSMPTVFTPFRNKVEDRSDVRRLFTTPATGQLPFPAKDVLPQDINLEYVPKDAADLNVVVPKGSPRLKNVKKDERAAFTMAGGENVALERLHYYLWDSNLIQKYFEIRNGMIGSDYSTKLAPALAHGCISPRQIYWDIKKYEDKLCANKSTYWVIFELIWRDYFKFYALSQGNGIFRPSGPIGKRRAWKNDPALFQRWKDGLTGWPLVDANMRELKATGFMSNRGRQNVASFLCLDLGLDWRLGADYFETQLLDYDPASNWGNWVAAAGLTGGRVNKFNITKQSKDYDPDGEYIRLWIPELAKVPATKIHDASVSLSRKEQDIFGVQIGQDYPQAIKSSYSFNQKTDGKIPSRFGKQQNSRKKKGPPRSRPPGDYGY